MVFKLKPMNKVCIFPLLLIFFSCKSKIDSLVSTTENDYVLGYKTILLYGCLDEGTNSNFAKTMQESNDLGLAVESEILGKMETNEIIELGRNLSKKVKQINYADYEGKKPIFSSCVSFAFSKESDSLARYKFKESKKSKVEYGYD